MATMPEPPFSFVLVGAGTVGTATAELLRRAGHRCIGVASRSAESRQRAASLLGAPDYELGDAPSADVVLLGVTDRAIAEVAEGVVLVEDRATVVIHLAGSLGTAPLEAVRHRGAIPCALHPVQACPDVETALQRLPGSSWGVTCPADARPWAHRVIRTAFDGRPVDVPEDARAIWHAAAVTTSNGIAALMALGERLLSAVDISDPEQVLGPLASGTVLNACAGGGGAATLTGPVVRGETETIARHVEALRRGFPEGVEDYRRVVELILAAAQDSARLDAASSAALRAALDGSR